MGAAKHGETERTSPFDERSDLSRFEISLALQLITLLRIFMRSRDTSERHVAGHARGSGGYVKYSERGYRKRFKEILL